MAANFRIQIRKRNNDLYMDLKGDFDAISAYQVLKTLKRHYNGNEKVYMNTEKLRRISPFGVRVFHSDLHTTGCQKKNINFIGEPRIYQEKERYITRRSNC